MRGGDPSLGAAGMGGPQVVQGILGSLLGPGLAGFSAQQKRTEPGPYTCKSPGELFIIGWQEPVEISAMYQELGPGTDCLSPRAVTQCQASVVNTLHLVLLSPSGSE